MLHSFASPSYVNQIRRTGLKEAYKISHFLIFIRSERQSPPQKGENAVPASQKGRNHPASGCLRQPLIHSRLAIKNLPGKGCQPRSREAVLCRVDSPFPADIIQCGGNEFKRHMALLFLVLRRLVIGDEVVAVGGEPVACLAHVLL